MKLTLEELKKLPSAKKRGIPLVKWATTGGTRGNTISSGAELRSKLADGMAESDIGIVFIHVTGIDHVYPILKIVNEIRML